ncbi:MAG TPA: PEP/pyruvate-binding domain-containing protein [Terriglobia bacterium]|nr:PEP/pyruvate-binding domain-containing protein [Terriglobia bacterium]
MSSAETIPFILKLDSPEAALELVGGKGASLARMAAAGLPVPSGYLVTTHAYRYYVSSNGLVDAILAAAAQADADDPTTLERAAAQIQSLLAASKIPEDVAALIERSYSELGQDDPPVAVRSSATAEDLPEMSFAGQMETYLNVCGAGNVLAAVKRCWGSLWTARALSYRAQHGVRPEDVSMAVVVQQLIPADVAGILFTANPLTGARDHMMINAAWGLGEAIVGGQVTPDTIVVAKQTGAISSQDISPKEVMTVRVPGGTREEPVPAEKRRRAALPAAQAAELVRLGAEIEQLYGQPMDIEWAMCGERIFILQARPITALPEPRVTLEWKLPSPGKQYARSSVIELLPNPLLPLFATLALPVWNKELRALMQSIGSNNPLSNSFRLVTVNEYAYTEFGLSAWQSARLIVALPALLPKFTRLLRSARARWADEARPRYANLVAAWARRNLAATPSSELLTGALEIVRAAASHYVAIQTGILPVSTLSEAAFTFVYNRLIKRKGEPPALTFILGFDSVPIKAEKSLYDLASWARSQPELADYLARAASQDIVRAFGSQPPPLADAESWREFTGRFTQHLEDFGHAVYDLDFASSVPADDPGPLLETLKYFLSGQARSPYERQAAAALAREQATQSVLARLKGLRLRILRFLVQTAQCYAPLREDALADVGLGWPQLRRMLREVGRRMVAVGAIAQPDDVYCLTREEAEAAARALDAGQPVEKYAYGVAARRVTQEVERNVTPPVALPIKGGLRLLGIDVSRWLPARTGQRAGNVIKGVGASPGRVVSVARVIHGPDEFGQMQPGDILVAKITTPAWTALFALAAAVVTDVGGPLSHSSIVAREYHIPAVLGTGVATERIRSGQRITVDGDAGTVRIVD